MAKLINIEFNENISSANNGKIVITLKNLLDFLPASNNMDWHLEIFDPAENSIALIDPDATFDSPTADDYDLDNHTADVSQTAMNEEDTLTFDIPVDANGNYLLGEYRFDVRLRDRDEADGTIQTKYLYTYDFQSITGITELSVTEVADCWIKTLVVQDDTDYGDYDVDRTINITAPTVQGYSLASAIAAGGALASVALQLYNVTYQISVASVVTKETLSGVDSNDGDDYEFGIYEVKSFSYTNGKTIVCDKDGCGLISCADSYLRDVLNKACARGGVANLTREDQETFGKITAMIQMYQWAHTCKNQDMVDYYYQQLKELLSDCGCLNTTTPTLIPDNTVINYVINTNFLNLTDTPSNFTDDALKLLRVNSDEDEVEFIKPIGTGVAPTGATDVTVSTIKYYNTIMGTKLLGTLTVANLVVSTPKTLFTLPAGYFENIPAGMFFPVYRTSFGIAGHITVNTSTGVVSFTPTSEHFATTETLMIDCTIPNEA